MIPFKNIFLALAGTVVTAAAAESTNTPAPPALTPEQLYEGGTNSFTNWIELATGGFFISGDKAQFQQLHQVSGYPYGGLQDFHYQENLDKTTTLTANGHALFNEHDYKLRLGIQREKVGYLNLSYDQSREWENGAGGFFPPTGAYYSLPGNALGLDRANFGIEAGLTLDNKPKIVFKYNHKTREGEEASTSWGLAHPDSGSLTRGISPSFYGINERIDSFQLDISHHIDKTDVGLGFTFETGKLNDALNITQFPTEPLQQKTTDREGTSYDQFSVHTYTETWITNNLMLSSGFSYTHLDNNFSGSRIYGSDFDVGYVPNAQNGFGYYGLAGDSRLNDYVMDLNLLYRPSPHLTIIPSIRVQDEDWNAYSSGMETLENYAAVPFTSDSDRGVLDVIERLDLRYNGLTNWVFTGRGDWTEGHGNLNENGGVLPIEGIGLQPVLEEMEDNRFFQKYSLGAKWYPDRRVAIDLGGYYKFDHYGYDFNYDSTPNNSASRYPGYLVMQDFQTYDGNFRLTIRPRQNVTLISRYEYQWSTIDTTPDPVSGLPDVESSTMNTHVIAQDVSWVPFSRWSLQAGLDYVLSETKTPASQVTQAILNSQNNYWTVNVSSDVVLDNKTDLRLSYLYYAADNYVNNDLYGVPYGASDGEHNITATLTRRIRPNLRWMLRYGFFLYNDLTYGGNQDFRVHMIYTSLQYRF
ncbi:MAG: hypothetical protein ACLQVY_28015 [Limisphaerales bacterium]